MTNTLTSYDAFQRFLDMSSKRVDGILSRRDRTALLCALECLRAKYSVRHVSRYTATLTSLHNAQYILACGGVKAQEVWRALCDVSGQAERDCKLDPMKVMLVHARLAIALRTLLRLDEHGLCDREVACCSSVGVYTPCPYEVEPVDDTTCDAPAVPRRIRPLWDQAPATRARGSQTTAE